MTPRLLLKPAEAAEALGISRSRLYELMATGDLPSVHVLGRSRRVALVDLEAFIERLRRQNEEPGRADDRGAALESR